MSQSKENLPKLIHKVRILVDLFARARIYNIDKLRIVNMDFVRGDPYDRAYPAKSDSAAIS
jgi:hypothetical protein